MSTRRASGGTLAFVAVSAIVIILVGIGFFLLARLLGGGQEAQHATDSGNLNVAKQILITPAIADTSLSNPITTMPAPQYEYSGLFDSVSVSGSNVVNLKNFNRFVGKAFLVALNAADEGSAVAKTNAINEIAQVEGTGGIGDQLAAQLAAASNAQGFFNSLAASNSVRMLNTDSTKLTQNDSNNYQVSYMLQNAQAPSNVFVNPGVISTSVYTTIAGDTNDMQPRSVSGATVNFLCGYHDINIPGIGDVYAVPLRPGEQPHLVGQDKFADAKISLLPGGAIGSLIPPNAFYNGSLSKVGRINADVNMRSAAIVGIVDTSLPSPTNSGGQYPAAIPHGFVVIDNSQSGINVGSITTTSDLASEKLMEGVYIETYNGTGYVDVAGDGFQALSSAAPSKHGGANVALSIGNNVYPPITNQTTLNNVANDIANNAAADENFCLDYNITGGSEGTDFSLHQPQPIQNCANALTNIEGAFPPSGTVTTTVPISGLMAIEALKFNIIQIRCSAGGKMGDKMGCATSSNISPACTGLNYWGPNNVGNKIPFSSTGTLSQLLSETDSSGTVNAALLQRMSEMKGSQVTSDPVFNKNVAMGSVYSLYYDGSSFQLAPNLPPSTYYDSSVYSSDYTNGIIPDGTQVSYDRNTANLPGHIIDVDKDGGYTHPWDCEYPGASTQDTVKWTPSSGYDNLLGVVQFENCVTSSSGVWCCPC